MNESDIISPEGEDTDPMENSDEKEAAMQEVQRHQQIKHIPPPGQGRTPVGSEIPVAPDCVMGVTASGRVTQIGIDKLIKYLELIKASFPKDGERVI